MYQIIILFLSVLITASLQLTSVSDLFPLSLEDEQDLRFIQSHNGSVKMLADNYRKKFEVQLVDELYSQIQLAVPITSCHDSMGGSGGDMSFTISIGLSTSNSLDSALAMPVLNLFSLSGSMGVSRSYSVSSSYTCNIPKGSRGQIWAAPFAVLGLIRQRSLYTDLHDKIMSIGDWSTPFTVKVPSAVSPMISCRTDKYAACTIPVPIIRIPLSD